MTTAFCKILVRKDSLSPQYFLGDAGYDISNTVLTPYRGGCQYPVKTQVQLVYALTAIHNFIIKDSGEDKFFEEPELISGNDQKEPPRDQSVSVAELREAAVKRENIAK
ncbi:hypothetical protein PsorP6_009897 [Peronosclerospora sorghi]|uniref:Uncharacterized protein n=1 Tax=Peronosclerospora sorghi TaxID=230839 RepID=A0ACC0VZ95_9STRA|nr:hypothetical protein PsorP6_009897 [Peronosclerospora sorghi]